MLSVILKCCEVEKAEAKEEAGLYITPSFHPRICCLFTDSVILQVPSARALH
jgi:hypothetical protein